MNTSRSILCAASIGAGMLAATLWLSGCRRHTDVKLDAGTPSGSLIAPNTLSVVFPIVNDSDVDAQDVRASKITLTGGTLLKPASLPVALGDVAEDDTATVEATLSGAFADGGTYTMSVEGSFADHGHRFNFAVTQELKIPPGPGSNPAGSGSSPAHTVNGAHFPYQPPNFPGEVNEGGHGWTVPEGPDRPAATPSQPSSVQPAPEGDPPGIDVEVNTKLGFSSNSTPNEPSGSVSPGGIIFQTANSYASYSTNGSAFTRVQPTTIFPNNVDGGFCCDQIVQYAPGIDRFIWVMQYSKGSNGLNRYRVAAASPASVKSSGAASWTYWDITAVQIDDSKSWLDYPDLSLGNNYAYLSADSVGGGRIVVRIPLAQIKAGATINFNFTHSSDGKTAYGSHLTQNTQDTIYWAGQKDSSTLRIFSWPESSSNYGWTDVPIGKWNKGALSSTTPDNKDWLHKASGFPGNAVLAATRFGGTGESKGRVNQLLLGWTAASGGSFKQAQVQWVALDLNNNYKLVSQQQIWSPSYAYAYPAFAVDANHDLGMSLESGGGGDYENHVIGFWGDYVMYATTASNVGTTRYGDYVTIRPYSPDTKRLAAFGYGQQTTGFDTRFVVFSRPGQ